MRHEIISWDRRQEIFSWGPLPTRKSPVSRENLMSHAFSINPMRKSHEIWDYLMRQKTGDFLIGAPPHKKISCLTRKSHVSCLPYKSHKKISWDMKFSHETGDRRLSLGGPHEKISCLMRKSNVLCLLHKSKNKISWDKRLSHETQENLLPYEKILYHMPSP